jgi:hypothetical protein
MGAFGSFGCEELKRLQQECAQVFAELAEAEDALRLTPKRDSKAYAAAKSRVEQLRKQYRHLDKEWLRHANEHQCR